MSNTDRFHRVLRAPAERIYRAFLDADAMAKWLPPNGFTGKVHHLDAKVGEGDRRGLAKCEGQFACLIRAGSHWRDRGNFSVKPDPDELNGAEGPSSYNESHGFAGPLKPLQARDL